MRLPIQRDMEVSVPAAKAWHVLAHEYANIDQWSSAIPKSEAVAELAALPGAPAGGRVCSNNVPGFKAVTEAFTHFDEGNYRFGYQVVAGLPGFVRRAENNYRVIPLGHERCLIEIRGAVELKPPAGWLLAPFIWLQFQHLARQTTAELRHFLETDQPHPRKRR